KVLDSAVFRITRDSELELDDEGGRAFLETVEDELRKRRRSQVVRVEVEAGLQGALLETLTGSLEVRPEDVYLLPPPLDLRSLSWLLDLPALEDLRDKPLRPLPL